MPAKPPSPPEPRRPPRGPVSVATRIMLGPRFIRDVATEDEERAGCVCGLRSGQRDGRTWRDLNTRLCVDCWRAWRWGYWREFATEGEPGWTPPEVEPTSTVPSGTSTGVSERGRRR